METWAAQGHVAGMLDRDQRTAKSRGFDRHVVRVKEYEDPQTVLTRRNKAISHRRVPGRTSPHSSCKTRKNGHFWKSLYRLKHALIVGTYLSLLTFPSILSAPTTPRPMSSRESMETSEPKWLNPCGMGSSVNGAAPEHRMPDSKLIERILNIAIIAESKAKSFRDDYVLKEFKMSVEKMIRHHSATEIEWLRLKDIPKTINHPVPQEYLESLEFKQTLLDVYVYLQKIAVGMEQVVWEEEDRNGEFTSSFAETEDFLRNLLCEIQTAIIENDLKVTETVTRDIKGNDFDDKNETGITHRHWVVYRNYLNILEFIVQVFGYFQANLSE